MSYATSLAGLTTMALQGRIEVFDQYLSVERLTQEAGCSGFQASKVRPLFSLWRKDWWMPACLEPISFVRFVVISQQSKIFLHVESHNGFVSNSLRLNFH
jgi:hypothetical protein